MDRERSANLRRLCNVENLNQLISREKQEWNDQINRMKEDRIVRISRDKFTKRQKKHRKTKEKNVQ